MRGWHCVILTVFIAKAISGFHHSQLYNTVQRFPDDDTGDLIDFDSLVETLVENPSLMMKKNHVEGKDDSNSDDDEVDDNDLRHLIDGTSGLRVMKRNTQQANGDPTMNLRVMRAQDPTIGLRVMRSDPLMNLRVMRASTQNSQRAASRLLRNTDNNMNMRIMLRNDPDRNWIFRMRRSAGADNHVELKDSEDQIVRTMRGNPSMGLRVMKKRSYM